EGYERFFRAVKSATPADAVVLVASHGDEEALRAEGRRMVHFPAVSDGAHPQDGFDAVAQLRQDRRDGATHLAIPQPQLWWLDYYRELRHHLQREHERVYGDEQCVIYELRDAPM